MEELLRACYRQEKPKIMAMMASGDKRNINIDSVGACRDMIVTINSKRRISAFGTPTSVNDRHYYFSATSKSGKGLRVQLDADGKQYLI